MRLDPLLLITYVVLAGISVLVLRWVLTNEAPPTTLAGFLFTALGALITSYSTKRKEAQGEKDETKSE